MADTIYKITEAPMNSILHIISSMKRSQAYAGAMASAVDEMEGMMNEIKSQGVGSDVGGFGSRGKSGKPYRKTTICKRCKQELPTKLFEGKDRKHANCPDCRSIVAKENAMKNAGEKNI